MHGDTAAIRHLADLLREQADDVRSEALRLADRARAAPWEGRAAEAMRAGVDRHAGELRATAELHDRAAEALLAHAAAVEQTRAMIAAVEAGAHALVAGARSRMAGVLRLVGGVVDPVDDLLDRFVAPVTGSLEWLHVDLPGLGPVPRWSGLPGFDRLVA